MENIKKCESCEDDIDITKDDYDKCMGYEYIKTHNDEDNSCGNIYKYYCFCCAPSFIRRTYNTGDYGYCIKCLSKFIKQASLKDIEEIIETLIQNN